MLPPHYQKSDVDFALDETDGTTNREFSSQWVNLTSATTVDEATSSAVHWRSTRNAATTISRMWAWRPRGRS